MITKYIIEKEKWSKDVKTKWKAPEGFFKQSSSEIATGLKKAHKDLKSSMSALDFYINRSGKNISQKDKDRLELAKEKLHKIFKSENYKREAKIDDVENAEELVNFIKENPYPEDTSIHELADSLGIDPSELETIAYALLSAFFCGGNSYGKEDVNVTPEDVDLELEHTDKDSEYSKFFAEKIAKDHISEFENYYPALKEMESELVKEKNGNEKENKDLPERDEM